MYGANDFNAIRVDHWKRHLALKSSWLGSREVLVSMPELAKLQKSLQDFPPRQKGAGIGAQTLSVPRR